MLKPNKIVGAQGKGLFFLVQLKFSDNQAKKLVGKK